MFVQLNFKSGKPVYLQVVDQIKAAAASGALHAGEPLPSIRPLAEELRVNRNTIAKAYTELESQGVICVGAPFTPLDEMRLAPGNRVWLIVTDTARPGPQPVAAPFAASPWQVIEQHQFERTTVYLLCRRPGLDLTARHGL